MKPEFSTDTDLLDALRSKAPERINAALKHLFQHEKLRNSIRKQVSGMGGDATEVKEMLNQALIVFYHQVLDQTYQPELSSIQTYIVRIAAQMYYTKRRSENRRVAMYQRSAESVASDTQLDPERAFDMAHRKALLDEVLGSIGEKCKKLLKLRSFDYSMAEIAEKLQYKSPDVAKMAAQDCRKKLNQYLAERPDLLATLKSL